MEISEWSLDEMIEKAESALQGPVAPSSRYVFSRRVLEQAGVKALINEHHELRQQVEDLKYVASHLRKRIKDMRKTRDELLHKLVEERARADLEAAFNETGGTGVEA